jgi:adenylate cyclase
VALEIERKFLLRDERWRAGISRSERMAQGYLNDRAALESGRQHCSVRVRIAGESAQLNLKSRSVGAVRQEFEYPVPLADAEALFALCVGGRVEKVRHYVPHGSHLWEIDEFLGDSAGLVVAEIELDAPDADFARPDWLGAEVTDLPRYYNLALAARPYALWTDEERNPCS